MCLFIQAFSETSQAHTLLVINRRGTFAQITRALSELPLDLAGVFFKEGFTALMAHSQCMSCSAPRRLAAEKQLFITAFKEKICFLYALLRELSQISLIIAKLSLSFV